ncbi:MAG: hypothetical protein IH941_11800 [Acidobacteria bacterium]|nr:hypothetical protein [Acidobacteriota bacterium]
MEHFNRPYDEGRPEAVLHFALHAHEMLAKAILLKRGRRIQERRESKTISFGKCLNLLDVSGEKVLDENNKVSLLALSNVRDAAQHSSVSLSEQELFLHAQTAITVLDLLLSSEFEHKLADYLPQRVLPISTEPPESLELLVNGKVDQIKELLKPGRRRTVEARTRLRSLLAVDLAAANEQRTATPLELDRAAKRLKEGRAWKDVFPNLAALSLDASGTGQTYSVRLSKKTTAPSVRFAETEDEKENAAILRDVDVTDRYPFTVTELGRLSGLTTPKAGAMIWKLKFKADPEAYHEIRLGQSRFPRFSHAALKALRAGVAELDLEAVWQEYRSRAT